LLDQIVNYNLGFDFQDDVANFVVDYVTSGKVKNVNNLSDFILGEYKNYELSSKVYENVKITFEKKNKF